MNRRRFLGLSAAGCEDKLAKCKKTCADLDKEYMAKCVGEGAKYQASVEINFTLKD